MSSPAAPRVGAAAAAHVALYVYAALIRTLQAAALGCGGELDEALRRWPFLAPYIGELAERGLDGLSLDEAARTWSERIAAFEAATEEDLPLRSLAEAYGLGSAELLALAAALWADSEPRLAPLLEALHGGTGEPRLTGAALAQLAGSDCVRELVDLGLFEARPAEVPLALRSLAVPDALAAALQGRPLPASTDRAWRPQPELPELDDLILPERLRGELAGTARLFAEGRLDVLVLRGPARNGRSTLARAVASRLGRGVIERSPAAEAGDEPLAAALGAMTLLRLEPGVGETVIIPDAAWRRGPLAITLPPYGGVEVGGEARRFDVEVELPGQDEREALWRARLKDRCELAPVELARRWRMSSGAINRTARAAEVCADVAGRAAVGLADLAAARRMLGREALDTLASPVPPAAGWSALVAAEPTRSELATLEARCRHRQALSERDIGGGRARMTGVRALIKGTSGTGKTLAASALAGALGMELYRVDLAMVSSKYVGETEKNLERVLSAAESLDVMLLLDEGDSLLGARTATHSANDRFANLETNYLLQRFETLQAILVVTSNAPENIDTAFQRRMDVTVDFPPPGPEERAAIWRLHLPADHRVPDRWLEEVAWRCALIGGQIRNAAMHAVLLGLEAQAPVGCDHVLCAVEREHRKAGMVCPLRRIALVRAE